MDFGKKERCADRDGDDVRKTLGTKGWWGY